MVLKERKNFFFLCLPIKRSPMVYAYQGRINSTAGKCSTTQTTLQIGCHYSPPLSNMRLLCLTASSAVALMSLFLSGKQLSSPQYILAFLRSRIAYSWIQRRALQGFRLWLHCESGTFMGCSMQFRQFFIPTVVVLENPQFSYFSLFETWLVWV